MHPGKSWNFKKGIFLAWKVMEMTVVIESHAIPPIGHGVFLTEG